VPAGRSIRDISSSLSNILFESTAKPWVLVCGYLSLLCHRMLIFRRVYSGLAMRACIDIGLHRRHHARGHSLQGELKKRLFWACYYLEREVSIALGMFCCGVCYIRCIPTKSNRSTTSYF
jgi:hypothetical protein